jgi:hypothetical protein
MSIPDEQQRKPPLGMAFYERMIEEGIAGADRRGGAVDHVTARRIAIWLTARPQPPAFAHALTRFTRTGAVSEDLRRQLRKHAYSPANPHRSLAHRLVQYCASRSADPRPVGPDFAAACDQIDRADEMLAGLRDRVRQGIEKPADAQPDTEGPSVIARAQRDPHSRMVSLILDEATANIAMYAIAVHAGEREAHVREVERFGQGLPDGSYGKQNRRAIAARETRAAQRLRAVQQAYQEAAEYATAVTHAEAVTSPALHAADREIELE